MAKEEETLHTVGEVCRKYGITRKTLFYYDRVQLVLPSERSGSQNHKLYSKEDLMRLEKVLRYRNAGLTIEEIRNVQMKEDHSGNKEVIDYLNEIKERLIQDKKDKEEQIREIDVLIQEKKTE